MEFIKRHIDALQELVSDMEGRSKKENLLAYGTVKAIIDELRKENEENFNRNYYTSEKLTALKVDIKPLVGLRDEGGRPQSQHIAWCLQSLDALRSSYCFDVGM